MASPLPLESPPLHHTLKSLPDRRPCRKAQSNQTATFILLAPMSLCRFCRQASNECTNPLNALIEGNSSCDLAMREFKDEEIFQSLVLLNAR